MQPWPRKCHVREQTKSSFFLARLLELLAGQPCFRFEINLAGLTICLAIGRAESTAGKVAVLFLE